MAWKVEGSLAVDQVSEIHKATSHEHMHGTHRYQIHNQAPAPQITQFIIKTFINQHIYNNFK